LTNRIHYHSQTIFPSNIPRNIIKKIIIKETLKFVTLPGTYFEFGVYTGNSINFIAKNIYPELIYGFDSWQGLPEDWKVNNSILTPKYGLSTNGILPIVLDNVVLISGWFKDSLPKFCNDYPHNQTTFIHFDCDLYSSTKTVLSYLSNTIVNKTVVLFDEWFSYDNEQKAFIEWLDDSNKYARTLISSDNSSSFMIIDKQYNT
jgi:hypothetical protein